MEEKFRIKEYNEGQEEDKEEKYRDKNKRYDDTEQRRTPIRIQMRLKRTATDQSLTDHFYSEEKLRELAAALMRLCG